jgi:hypothetical protein
MRHKPADRPRQQAARAKSPCCLFPLRVTWPDRPVFLLRTEETHNEKENIMEDDDILHIEAQEFLRQASDEMLRLTALEEIDLNRMARNELLARRRHLGAVSISEMMKEFQS